MPHLVGLRDQPRERIQALLDHAAAIAARVEGGESRLGLLTGRTVGLLFAEPSTRTRFSFEMTAMRLGADCLAFSAAGSSMSKGETLLDTARLLVSVGAEVIVVRHKAVGSARLLSERLGVPVLNAGDGTAEHPTQALLDLFTLQRHLGRLEGRTVAIVGDITHSRVARSGIFGLVALGAKVLIAGPPTLCPPELAELGVEVRHTIDDVLEQSDALMMLRIQRERIGGAKLPPESEYRSLYALTEERAERMREGAIVLHPAPMNRSVEIDDAVADGPRSVIFEQMKNGVWVRMAALLDVLEVTP